jgi:hypothetical protein
MISPPLKMGVDPLNTADPQALLSTLQALRQTVETEGQATFNQWRSLKGDKGTQRHTAQDFETIEGTKNREPQSSSPNEYVP